jgi:hypothetical protein
MDHFDYRFGYPQHFYADPDPTFHFNADPDPALYHSDAIGGLQNLKASAPPL